MTAEGQIEFGEFRLDLPGGRLWRGQEVIPLRRKTFAVLRYLAERPGMLVTTEALLEAVWPGTFVSDGGLKVCIAELRKVLGDSAGAPRFIETVRGTGYRFAGTPGSRRPDPLVVEAGRLAYVGREREMAVLDAAAEAALSGSGRIVLIGGEAGIGKTRTVEELAARARARGAQVLIGRCSEEARATAFWPWLQILRAYVTASDPARLAEVVGETAADLAPLAPILHTRLPGLPAPPLLSPEEARFRFFDAMAVTLTNAARRQPLLLFFDDLHFADPSALQLLRYIAPEIAGAPLLIAGAYRDNEPDDSPLSAAIADLSRQPNFSRVILRGLTRAETDAFLAHLASREIDPDLAKAIFERTEGNPFFVQQIFQTLVEADALGADGAAPPVLRRGWEEELPAGVRAVLAARLARLSESCRRLLAVAALAGRTFAIDLLALVREPDGARRSLDELLAAIDEALAARVVARAGQRYRFRFTHPLLREAAAGELSAAARARLHLEIGRVLERMHAHDPDEHAAEVAYHFLEAADSGLEPVCAVRCARRAGEQAAGLLAYEAAVEQYEGAWRVVERCGEEFSDADRYDLLMALGEAYSGAGNFDQARAVYRRAAGVARRGGTPEQFARAVLGFAAEPREFEAHRAEGAEVTQLLEEAASSLATSESVLRARILARLAARNDPRIPAERRRALSQQAVEAARRAGYPATLAEALYSKRWSPWGAADASERLATIKEMIRVAEQAGDRPTAQEGRLWKIVTLLEIGEAGTMREEIRAYADVAELTRQPRYRWVAGWLRAMQAALAGRFDEAEAIALEALAVGRRVHERYAVRAYAVQLLGIRYGQGRLAEIEGALAGFVTPQAADLGWRCSLAGLYSELGRIDEARREFQSLAAGDFAALAEDMFRPAELGILADVCATLDDAEHARRLSEMLSPFAGRVLVVGAGLHCLGSAARPLGRLAGVLGRWREAETHFERALHLEERLGSPPLLARTYLDYATTLAARAASQKRAVALRSKALDYLAAAEEIAQSAGLRTILAAAATLRTQLRSDA